MLKTTSSLIFKIKNHIAENKNLYLVACIFYFLNSFSNVSQGILTKFFTKNTQDFTFYQFMAIRCLVGALALLPFALKHFSYGFKFGALRFNILISFLSAMDIILWNTGLKTVPVNNGILIAFLVPIWSVVLARLILKEKDFSIFHFISFALCFLAIFILIKDSLSFENFNIGYLFIFANTINIPLSLILQKKWNANRPIMYGIFSNLLFGFVICFALSGFTFPVITKKVIFSAGAIACFDILEYFSVYVAYKLHPIASLQPIRFTRIILSGLFSYLLLNEALTVGQLFAICAIVIANTIVPVRRIYIAYKKNKI